MCTPWNPGAVRANSAASSLSGMTWSCRSKSRSAYAVSAAFTMFESPLQLIAHVVDDDQPFKQIVTTRDLWVNEPMSLAVGGTWYAGGDEWQREHLPPPVRPDERSHRQAGG